MVKIPSMDDLKKAGANLMDQAKSSALADKFKSGVESIGVSMAKGETTTVKSTDPIVQQFEAVQITLAELMQTHNAQAQLIAVAQAQLNALTQTVATLQALQTPEKKG
jgi:erythromycin esterase-like protein